MEKLFASKRNRIARVRRISFHLVLREHPVRAAVPRRALVAVGSLPRVARRHSLLLQLVDLVPSVDTDGIGRTYKFDGRYLVAVVRTLLDYSIGGYLSLSLIFQKQPLRPGFWLTAGSSGGRWGGGSRGLSVSRGRNRGPSGARPPTASPHHRCQRWKPASPRTRHRARETEQGRIKY